MLAEFLSFVMGGVTFHYSHFSPSRACGFLTFSVNHLEPVLLYLCSVSAKPHVIIVPKTFGDYFHVLLFLIGFAT